MKLFGQLQVLFKVATPPKPGQPPGDQSYVMSEGDRQDGIAVNKIDEQAGIITFDNHGVIQQLPLETTPNVSTPAAGFGPGSGAAPPMRRFLGGRFGRDRDLSGGGGNPGAMTAASSLTSAAGGQTSAPGSFPTASGYNGVQVHANTGNPDGLTPEAQVIMMEANRQQLQQQPNEVPPELIPPTPLTPSAGQSDDPNPR
jgi:hypothetical protein